MADEPRCALDVVDDDGTIYSVRYDAKRNGKKGKTLTAERGGCVAVIKPAWDWAGRMTERRHRALDAKAEFAYEIYEDGKPHYYEPRLAHSLRGAKASAATTSRPESHTPCSFSLRWLMT